MILIDATYINMGGAKVLLEYLIQEIEMEDIDVYYLLDNRCIENIKVTPKKYEYIHPSFLNRLKFYIKNRNKFSSVLCFGNIPPPIRLKSKVYTYFHQLLYVEIPESFTIKSKLIFNLKIQVLKLLKNNTDFWFVQSSIVNIKLKEKFNLNKNSIINLPFYPPFDNKNTKFKRESNTYVYVSHASEHKNHRRLIESFSNFYKKTKKGKLFLTISEEHSDIFNLIVEKQKDGINIININFISRDKLDSIYQVCEYAIYPSIAESFGLGIIEALENGCKIIASDLPYTYAVCSPSITFNPYDVDSIAQAFNNSIIKNELPSTLKVKNQIKDLILFLK